MIMLLLWVYDFRVVASITIFGEVRLKLTQCSKMVSYTSMMRLEGRASGYFRCCSIKITAIIIVHSRSSYVLLQPIGVGLGCLKAE